MACASRSRYSTMYMLLVILICARAEPLMVMLSHPNVHTSAHPLTQPISVSHPMPVLHSVSHPMPVSHSIPVNRPLPVSHSVPVSHSIPISHSMPVSHPITVSHPIPVSHSMPIGHPIPVSHPVSVSHPMRFSHPMRVSHPVPVSQPIPVSHSFPLQARPMPHFPLNQPLQLSPNHPMSFKPPFPVGQPMPLHQNSAQLLPFPSQFPYNVGPQVAGKGIFVDQPIRPQKPSKITTEETKKDHKSEEIRKTVDYQTVQRLPVSQLEVPVVVSQPNPLSQGFEAPNPYDPQQVIFYKPVAEYRPVLPVATQYHSQDVLGQATYGYYQPGNFHHVMRDLHGGVTGAYSYIDPKGEEVRVKYIADENGYRVASNAVPKPSADVVKDVTPIKIPKDGEIPVLDELPAAKTKRHIVDYPIPMTPYYIPYRLH